DRDGASAGLQKATGLSHVPIPVEKGALAASLRRHYPRNQVGRRGAAAVVVDVSLDDRGIVHQVKALPPPSSDPGGSNQIVVLRNPAGSNTPVQHALPLDYDPAFGPAAEAAIREVRFRPALRAGQPVAYTIRMTVQFAPQS
ncbi:MAG TPA: hypothetical protein VEY93_05515, partial [Longimicrobium sp.]|nr:hypothetical protein [Longimicrobium sp.]